LSRDNARERDLYKNEAIKANEFNLKKIQENQRKRQEERDRVKDENTSQLRMDHLRDI
jgi:ribosomal protein L9